MTHLITRYHKLIEIEKETVLCLRDAAKLLPKRRAGKRPSIATLYRWASSGLRGVRLETIQVGGTLCTSTEAVQRFCQKLSNISSNAEATAVAPIAEEPDGDERELQSGGW